MYQIKIDGITLRPEVNAYDVMYWQTRLAKMFPKCIVEIIRVNNERES